MIKKLSILLILSVPFIYSLAFADAPVIYFSDLSDGPKTGWEGSLTKGAAVTIWGENFGSTRGASYLTVGGVSLANDSDYAEWGVTTNNARGLERITFYLNNNCANGAGTISVTVGGIISNTVPFYIRQTGYIYFVDMAKGRNDFNGYYASYKDELNGPWQTLEYARRHINGGEIVYIRNGAYSQPDEYNSILYLDSAINGYPENYTAFVGYPTEFPILDGTVNGAGGVIRNNYRDTGYTLFSKMKLIPRLSGIRISQSTISHYRIVGMEIDGRGSGGGWVGAIDPQDISDVAIYGCHIHNYGRDKFDHGIYVGSNGAANNINFDIGWNEINDLGNDVSGIYIHPQDSGPMYADKISIHDNLCYNLSHAGIHLASYIRRVNIWNNVLFDCGSGSERGVVQFNCTSKEVMVDIKFFNNILHSAANSSLIIFQGDSNVRMNNNILYSLSNTSYYSDDGYAGTRTSNQDLYYGNGKPSGSWIKQAINSDPKFINPKKHNYRLQNSSPVKEWIAKK